MRFAVVPVTAPVVSSLVQSAMIFTNGPPGVRT